MKIKMKKNENEDNNEEMWNFFKTHKNVYLVNSTSIAPHQNLSITVKQTLVFCIKQIQI